MIEFVITKEELDEDTTAVPVTQILPDGSDVQFDNVDENVYTEAISITESIHVREGDLPADQDWTISMELSLD